MRAYLGIGLIGGLLIISPCKAQQKVNSPTTDTAKTAQSKLQDTLIKKPAPKHSNTFFVSGRVSHRYAYTGCGPVIVTDKVIHGDTLIFDPMQKLNEFDVEGLEISFNYRPLAIMHPKSCGKAQPVYISNVKKVTK